MNHKALIICGNDASELNKHLADGWTVLHTCPMPSSPAASSTGMYQPSAIPPTCLVIIGKYGLLPKA